MQKIIAVRVTDVGDDLVVEGFVARGKNRRRVWRVVSEGKDRIKLRQEIAIQEELRAAGEPTQLQVLQDSKS